MKTQAEWLGATTRVAQALPLARLHPEAIACARRRPRGEKWAIAFSGGADSLALLLLLWAHWPERRRRLVALHFDHRLRAASRADAAFCARVCAALRVRLVTGVWRDAQRGASEAEARAARMAFFEKRSRVLWLGHQQDDIAESMLMRLARGSGTGGLAAPRPVQPMPGGRVHLRPLLTLKKAEIEAGLRAAGVRWREDASNARGDYFRNRIRHDVLPRWLQAAGERDALGGAALARERLDEDDAALEAWLDELKPMTRAGALDLTILAGKPRALLRRALHRWLARHERTGVLVRQGFEALVDAVAAGRPTRQSVGAEGFAVVRAGRLHWEVRRNRARRFQRRAN